MSGYRMVRTRFFRPAAEAVPGAPAQGEWVNVEPQAVTESWGALRARPAEISLTELGQGSRQFHRWRGPVFDGHRPEPGWEVEIGSSTSSPPGGGRFRILSAVKVLGKVWRLDLERLDG